jgi:hypothetical protein
MFDRAGRLQDLYEQIEESGNITAEDIKTIKSISTNKRAGKSIYDDKSDEEIIQ